MAKGTFSNSRATVLDAAGGTFEVGSGQTLTQIGAISGPGSLTKSGPGTLTLRGSLLHAGSIRVQEGTLRLGGADKSINALIVDDAAGAVIGIDGYGIVATTQLQLTGSATVDLTDDSIIVDYSPAAGSPLSVVRNQIMAGFAGGTWSGNGIRSSGAAGNAQLAIGYGEASAIFGISGAQTATWQGRTVDASSVLIRTVLQGDVNLDGVISFPDLLAVSANYGRAGVDWSKGDVDYDGFVSFPDLLIVAARFGAALPAAVPGAGAEFNAALAQVPEPAGIIVLLMWSMLARRR
jgi:autotransporter-associated beta strand protein